MDAAVKVATVKLLIGGQFVESQTTEWRDVVNPATQQVLARVPFATQDEINAAVASAKEAFKTWKKTPIGARARIFLKLQQLIRENMAELAALLTAEQGKTLPDAEGDVFRGLEVVEHASQHRQPATGRAGQQRGQRRGHLHPAAAPGRVRRHHALQLPRHDSAVDVPHGHCHGQHLRAQALRARPHGDHAPVRTGAGSRHPPGVLNVIHGGEMAVNAICDHPDIKAISFVGSTKVGTHVYNRASLNGKRVQCMMGAKNHAIVVPDANKEQTLNALAGAAFGAAGQRCMALSVVVLVGEAQKWIPELVAKAKTLKVSGGTEKGTDVGPVISCAALSTAWWA
jgi:malonate-semialdehyde dehydrogenase (acetylating)/methylmalonate-semialdehyde dehydrogenase